MATTEPLCGKEWVAKHEIPRCIRCGQCCLHVPCWWAQIWYGLDENNSHCPDLKRGEDGFYMCLMMSKCTGHRKEMLGTGCWYPEWRGVKLQLTGGKE